MRDAWRVAETVPHQPQQCTWFSLIDLPDCVVMAYEWSGTEIDILEARLERRRDDGDTRDVLLMRYIIAWHVRFREALAAERAAGHPMQVTFDFS